MLSLHDGRTITKYQSRESNKRIEYEVWTQTAYVLPKIRYANQIKELKISKILLSYW